MMSAPRCNESCQMAGYSDGMFVDGMFVEGLEIYCV